MQPVLPDRELPQFNLFFTYPALMQKNIRNMLRKYPNMNLIIVINLLWKWPRRKSIKWAKIYFQTIMMQKCYLVIQVSNDVNSVLTKFLNLSSKIAHFQTDFFSNSGSDVKPAKDNVPDEKLSMNQIQLRYSQCPELVKRVLSLMDFEKINYDLIEAVIEYILEGPDFPKKGSILVFLPGLQEIMTLYDQICKNPRYVLYIIAGL